jgi:hypothetical protein
MILDGPPINWAEPPALPSPPAKEDHLNRKRSCLSGVVAVVTSVSLSGCSFLFVNGPPDNHKAMPYFDCTSSVAAPVLDTVWAGLNGLGAASAASASDAQWKAQGQSNERGTVAVVGLVWLMISGASAIRGYQLTSDCREAKGQLAARLTQPRPSRPGIPLAPGAPPVLAPVSQPELAERCHLVGTPSWDAADPVEKQRLLHQCWDSQRAGAVTAPPAPAAPPPPSQSPTSEDEKDLDGSPDDIAPAIPAKPVTPAAPAAPKAAPSAPPPPVSPTRPPKPPARSPQSNPPVI